MHRIGKTSLYHIFLTQSIIAQIKKTGMEASLMEKFLFIPPVDDSLKPLKARQWFWLSASFLVSIALFALAESTHGQFSVLPWFFIGITAIPMKVYAQNRKGRIIGFIFLAIVCGYILYVGWNRIEAQLNQSPFIILMLVALCCWAYWFTLETAKVNQEFLKRMDILLRSVNSTEFKLAQIERTIRQTKPETEEIRAR
jgi:hypothetical protein